MKTLELLVNGESLSISLPFSTGLKLQDLGGSTAKDDADPGNEG